MSISSVTLSANADDVASRGGKLGDLAQCGPRIPRVRVRHRLDADGMRAAERHAADMDGACFASCVHVHGAIITNRAYYSKTRAKTVPVIGSDARAY